MPSGIVPNEGLADQTLECLGALAPGALPWQLLLWTNDIVPDFDTVLADLVEATFDGYTRINLDRAEWQNPVVAAGIATSDWGVTASVWYVTGGPVETIYGVAYVDPSTGKLRFVQRFDPADIEPIVIGGRVNILPRYQLTTGAF